MQNIGKNIRKIRTAKGITQEQLAEQMNLTRQAISSWETGKTEPDSEAMKKMAEIFGCTLDDIIYGEKQNSTSEIGIRKTEVTSEEVGKTVKNGITFGAALAMVISYTNWHSIGWAILHGLMSWVYVIYYAAKYGWN